MGRFAVLLLAVSFSLLMIIGCAVSSAKPRSTDKIKQSETQQESSVDYQGLTSVKAFYQKTLPAGYKAGMPISAEGYSLDFAYQQMQHRAASYQADAVLIQSCKKGFGYTGYECTGWLLKRVAK